MCIQTDTKIYRQIDSQADSQADREKEKGEGGGGIAWLIELGRLI